MPLTDVEKLADMFGTVLRENMTEAQFTEMLRRNRALGLRQDAVCASHDFCDANEAMDEAFELTFGREMGSAQGDDTLVAAACKFGRLIQFHPREED